MVVSLAVTEGSTRTILPNENAVLWKAEERRTTSEQWSSPGNPMFPISPAVNPVSHLSTMKASDKSPSLTHDRTNNNQQEQRSWSTLGVWPWPCIHSHGFWKLLQAIQVLVYSYGVFGVFAWRLYCVRVTSLLCSCDVFTVFVWRLYCVRLTSLLWCDVFPVFVWCLLLCSYDVFTVFVWRLLLCSCDV